LYIFVNVFIEIVPNSGLMPKYNCFFDKKKTKNASFAN